MNSMARAPHDRAIAMAKIMRRNLRLFLVCSARKKVDAGTNRRKKRQRQRNAIQPAPPTRHEKQTVVTHNVQ